MLRPPDGFKWFPIHNAHPTAKPFSLACHSGTVQSRVQPLPSGCLVITNRRTQKPIRHWSHVFGCELPTSIIWNTGFCTELVCLLPSGPRNIRGETRKQKHHMMRYVFVFMIFNLLYKGDHCCKFRCDHVRVAVSWTRVERSNYYVEFWAEGSANLLGHQGGGPTTYPSRRRKWIVIRLIKTSTGRQDLQAQQSAKTSTQ